MMYVMLWFGLRKAAHGHWPNHRLFTTNYGGPAHIQNCCPSNFFIFEESQLFKNGQKTRPLALTNIWGWDFEILINPPKNRKHSTGLSYWRYVRICNLQILLFNMKQSRKKIKSIFIQMFVWLYHSQK